MPTYDYECLKCKEKFEIFQKMSDKPIKKCIKCDGEMRRLIGTGAGLIFKGSGFYITDYKNKQNHVSPAKKPDNSNTTNKVQKKESSNNKSDSQSTKKAS